MHLGEEITREIGTGADFTVRGIVAASNRVYPLGSDTKVLSTIFEIFTRPILLRLAKRKGMVVEEAQQTIYPDFTLYRSKGDTTKIAVDVKTTYRRPTIAYTLGSYTSFLRNNTKNILYPYDHYAAHWIVGFVYDRCEVTLPRESYSFDELEEIQIPYKNVEWFVQEKYRISGDRPGSGNTANIGSIKSSNIDDFRKGNGPFATHGEHVFREYWASYGKERGRPYSTLDEFLKWRK
jgi:hypothetical protein